MDTLITGEKKPRSGLYTLQFSYMPMATEGPTVPSSSSAPAAAESDATVAAGEKNTNNTNNTKKDGAADDSNDAIDMSPPLDSDDAAAHIEGAALLSGGGDAEDDDEDPAVKEAKLQALTKACATEFGSWTLLCRLRFEGDVMGRIKGSVKVKSRVSSSSSLSTAAAADATADGSAANAAATTTVTATATAASAAVPTVGGSSPSASASASVAGPSPSPSSSSCGTRACIQSDSLWKPSDEVRLVIALDRLEGSVVGMRGDLTNVTIHCHSHVSDGWYVGAASITLSNGQVLKLPRRLQFLLKEYTGPRCSRCLDPIDAHNNTNNNNGGVDDGAAATATATAAAAAADGGIDGGAAAADDDDGGVPTSSSPSSSSILGCSECNCVQYCSAQCQEAHSVGHASICNALKPFGGPNGGGRAAASFAGAEFFVYWRCVKGCTFELMADHSSPLGVPYEILLNPLKDAREGLDYSFLTPSSSSCPAEEGDASSSVDGAVVTTTDDTTAATAAPSTSTGRPNISPQELNELNISIFFAVAQSSRDEGALLLTSACLNHLFAFCECVDNLVLAYFQFYDVCVRDQFEGVRHISCLSEYVMYVRTTFELGQTLLEWALKAPFASLFWQRLVGAKDVLVSLYNFNASLQFAPAIQNIKAILVPDQQRQTLHLLAKIFVVMASRAPKDLAQRLLRRAEECYKDSIDEDKPRKNFKEMGVTCLKLAALATMFESNDDKQKSKLFKDEGMELLKLAHKAAETAQRAKEVAAAASAAKTDAAAVAIATNIANAAAAAAGLNGGGGNVVAGGGTPPPQ